MFIRHSNFLCRNALKLTNIKVRKASDGGGIKDTEDHDSDGHEAENAEAEARLAHMEKENSHKKNQEYLNYIQEELKKGKGIEHVLDDTNDRLSRREKCLENKRKGIIPESKNCDEY